MRHRTIGQRYLILLLLFVVISTQAFEDEPALYEDIFSTQQIKPINTLEEIIIVASHSNSDISQLPYSASRVDHQQLQRNLVRNSVEALKELPGVMVQKTANGHGSPFIRGFTGYRTLAMIDGVRYNNSVYRDGPNEYFSLIDSYSLSTIELLNGPASTLYGSDAIGGTINLQTKSALNTHLNKGQQYITANQQYRYASAENSHSGRSEIALGEANHWGLLGGFSYKNYGDVKAADIGRQKKTGYQERANDLRYDHQINQQWRMTMLHQTLKQDDVWRTHSTGFAQSFAGTSIGDDQLRLKNHRRSLDYIKLNGKVSNNLIDEVNITLSRQQWHEQSERIKANGEQIQEYFRSQMIGGDLQFRSENDTISWVYGTDFYRDDVDTARTDYNADGSIEQVRIQGPVGDDSRYDLMGMYAQAQWFTSDQLTLLAGSRYTRTKAHIGAFEDPATANTATFDDSWNSLVSSLRASLSVNEQRNWQLWAGVSQSFRAPNIADLSRYGKSRSDELEVAAEQLDSESFITYEIGSKSFGANHQISINYYYTDIKDFISSTATGDTIDGLTVVSKQNSAGGYIQGVEFSGQYQLNDQWSFQTTFTWLEGQLRLYNSNNQQTVTEPFSRTMPFTVHASVKWSPKNNNSWLQLSATHAKKADKLSYGDRQDSQRIPPNGTPAYTVLSFRGGKTLNKNLSISFAIENLLNQAYRNHGSGSNEPGRGVVTGFNLRF